MAGSLRKVPRRGRIIGAARPGVERAADAILPAPPPRPWLSAPPSSSESPRSAAAPRGVCSAASSANPSAEFAAGTQVARQGAASRARAGTRSRARRLRARGRGRRARPRPGPGARARTPGRGRRGSGARDALRARAHPATACSANAARCPSRCCARSRAQVAGGLAALHAAGYVHGDVKPENMRLDEAGRAVLIDLGFALAAQRGRAREPRAPADLALPRPRARPRAAGLARAATCSRSGVVLYELASGRHPFAGPARRRPKDRARRPRARSRASAARRSLEAAGATLLAAIADGALRAALAAACRGSRRSSTACCARCSRAKRACARAPREVAERLRLEGGQPVVARALDATRESARRGRGGPDAAGRPRARARAPARAPGARSSAARARRRAVALGLRRQRQVAPGRATSPTRVRTTTAPPVYL